MKLKIIITIIICLIIYCYFLVNNNDANNEYYEVTSSFIKITSLVEKFDSDNMNEYERNYGLCLIVLHDAILEKCVIIDPASEIAVGADNYISMQLELMETAYSNEEYNDVNNHASRALLMIDLLDELIPPPD